MTKDTALFVTVTTALVAGFLAVSGALLWNDAPFPAEEALGKGIVVLAGATAIVALCAFLNVISARLEGDDQRQPQLSRSDWDDA